MRHYKADGTEDLQTLATAKAVGWTENFALRTDDSVVSQGVQIVPGEGYKFYAYVECQLLFPTN